MKKDDYFNPNRSIEDAKLKKDNRYYNFMFDENEISIDHLHNKWILYSGDKFMDR